ncbi:MAG TPA: hypothetical protein VEZ48_11240 [Sphingomonadaceae bacterium]|nr:hypothetical protein [Sphingomonadaceae bacterium]
MLVIALIAFVGILCWLLFNLTVYAVPTFVGLSVGFFAHQTGAGPFGAAVIGFASAVVTLVVVQRLFAATPSTSVRRALAFGFAAPAAFAGYHAALGITEMGTVSAAWAQVLALLGGAVVGAVAWMRLTALAPRGSGGASQAFIAES